ncbi:metabolite-proton symporter [Tamaricihabitans halophyticus]|uniref:Putative proline/betaine transporter n=1 Tax=Tamaricihabitans halophyticus TaxID=1262583 RepID=A0A4R2R0H1_9PSEU|nr:MFS transporter [Tamaricihabitans halophyticus]TCP55049.1 metabolite-proton symporter [Tamaricihabitans halophyticus]
MRPDQQHQPSHGIRRVVVASVVGNALEWYDFFLYGTAAALVFNQLFFPAFDPLAGTLASFGTFAVGFAARPFGGIVFGHFGDRLGRKKMLVITLTMMGVATCLIGLLPTYQAIGIWAPLLLTLLRIVQGIAVGGEWGGGVLLISEHAPARRRGFFSAWSQTGVVLGFVLSAAAFAVVNTLPESAFLSWGWRIPFVVSIVLAGVGLLIRAKLDETPEFQKLRGSEQRSRRPVVEAIRAHPRSVLVTMGARVAENGASYVFLVFALAYGAQIGMDRNTVLLGVVIASAIEGATMVGFGALSDRVGRRPVYLGGALGLIAFAFPFFWLLDTTTPLLVWLAMVVAIAGCHGAMIGAQPSFFAELFGSKVRYSGVSLGHELASVFAGGMSPIIATALLAWAGASWPIALYLVGLGVITVVAVLAAKETRPVDTEPAPATTVPGT